MIARPSGSAIPMLVFWALMPLIIYGIWRHDQVVNACAERGGVYVDRANLCLSPSSLIDGKP